MKISPINLNYINKPIFNRKKEISFCSQTVPILQDETIFFDYPEYDKSQKDIKRSLKNKDTNKYELLRKILVPSTLKFGFSEDAFSSSEYNEIIKFALENPQTHEIYKKNLRYATQDLQSDKSGTRKHALIQKQFFVDMTKKLNSNPRLVDVYSKMINVLPYFVLDSEFVLKLFEFDIDVLDAFLDKMMQLDDELKSKPCLSLQCDIQYILQALDLENLDEYAKVVKHEYINHNKHWFAKDPMPNYVNPYSGKFEPDVYWEAEKLGEKSWRFSPVETVKACFEYSTKGLSKELLKCAKRALFMCKLTQGQRLGLDTRDLPAFIAQIKDSDCNYSEINKIAAFDLLKIAISFSKKRKHVHLENVVELLKACKDNNGIVDANLIKCAKETLLISNTYYDAVTTVESIKSFKTEHQQNAYDKLMNITNDKKYNQDNFSNYASFCLGKNGEFLEDNYQYLKEITTLNSKQKYSYSFLSLMKNKPNYRDFGLELIKEGSFEIYQDFHYDFIGLISQKDGTINDVDKKRLFSALRARIETDEFCELYRLCKSVNDEEFVGFHDELFDFVVNLAYASRETYFAILKPKALAELKLGQFDYSELSFSDKIILINEIERLQMLADDKTVFNLELMEVCESLYTTLKPLEIDKTNKFDFIKNVLSSDDECNTNFENVLIDSIDYLKNLDGGLQLEYSKKDFLSELVSICPCDKLDEIASKLNIKLIYGPDGLINYNGIIQLDNLNLDDDLEHKIYYISHKFMYENSISTSNSELDNYLNQIIKALPEFINIIGKKQHVTHDHTLDIHILLTLAYAIQNPKYHQLPQKDKSIMKFAILLHDISKQYATVDENHPKQSASYARKISSKIFNSTEIQDRIYELILNHHWSKTINTTSDLETLRNLAFNFRRPNDFNIAQIMADSDIKAVNDRFYEKYSACITGDRAEKIADLIFKYQKAGNLVYTHKFSNPIKLEDHKVEYGGKEYKLVNLSQLDENAPVDDFGFPYGLVKKDLRFLVHMVDDESIKKNLNILKYLSVHSDCNSGVLSESIITPLHQRTYGFRKHGVILSQSNNDIILTSSSNKHTGTKKTIGDALRYAYEPFCGVDRGEWRKSLFAHLNINDNGITQEQFAEFYSKYLANLTSLAQINSNKIYPLVQFEIKGSDLIDAICAVQNELIDETHKEHNEILGYIPEIVGVISKSSSIEEVPADVLEFAYENDLPVVLI